MQWGKPSDTVTTVTPLQTGNGPARPKFLSQLKLTPTRMFSFEPHDRTKKVGPLTSRKAKLSPTETLEARLTEIAEELAEISDELLQLEDTKEDEKKAKVLTKRQNKLTAEDDVLLELIRDRRGDEFDSGDDDHKDDDDDDEDYNPDEDDKKGEKTSNPFAANSDTGKFFKDTFSRLAKEEDVDNKDFDRVTKEIEASKDPFKSGTNFGFDAWFERLDERMKERAEKSADKKKKAN